LGFYKVRDISEPAHKFEYEDRILNINQGDIIIWENDAEKTSFTIVSEQGLWSSDIGYMKVGQQISYKFDEPGTYNFYIKENTQMRQTIIVNHITDFPMQTNIPKITITSSPKYTPVPKYTPMTIPVTGTIVRTPIGTNNSTMTPVNVPIDIDIPDIKFPDIKIPIKISAVSFVAGVVALLTLIITFRTGKNKR